MTNHQEEYKQLVQNSKLLKEVAPEIANGFMGLHDAVITDGALTKKIKN